MTDKITESNSRIGQRIKLRELHILSTVVNWGSMAKAAVQLRMSQSSVSEAISNLEGALRVRLLDRSPQGVPPTIYANALLKRGHVVFDELIQGIRDIEFLADPTVGEVRLGCPESLAAGFLPTVIDRVSLRHPRIVVHVVHAESGTLEFRELRDRNIDFMLGRISGPLDDDALDAEILFKERYFVVAGRSSKWARRAKIELAELINEPWIHMPENSAINSVIVEAFHSAGLELPRQSVTSFSMHLRNHLLGTGRFLTVLSGSVLRSNAKSWSLKALPVGLDIQPRSVAIVTLKNRTLSPVVEVFLEHARAVAKLMRNIR
jgi:DNA-binding transcriptional LysR family regulator